MANSSWLRRFWLILLPAALWGCSPDGLQVPQCPLLKALERKSGLIAYVGPLGNIHTIDQGGGKHQAITTDADGQAIRYILPTWAPDGKQLAYFKVVLVASESDDDQGSPGEENFFLELYVVDARSGKTKRLTAFQPTLSFINLLGNFDQYQRSMTLWSPDSNNLVIPAILAEGAQGFAIVPASGDFEPRLLVEGIMASWSWK